MEEVDVVFHLAGQPGVRASWGTDFAVYVEDNVMATQRLLEAARGTELQRFVLASSSSIYGDAESFPTAETATPAPVSPYGVTKLAAEHLGRLYFKAHGDPDRGAALLHDLRARPAARHGLHPLLRRRAGG